MQNSYLIVLKDNIITIAECEEGNPIYIKKNGEQELSYNESEFWEWFKEKVNYDAEELSFIIFSDKSSFTIPCEANVILAEDNEFSKNKLCLNKLLGLSNFFNIFSYPQDSSIALEIDKIKRETKQKQEKKELKDKLLEKEKNEIVVKTISNFKKEIYKNLAISEKKDIEILEDEKLQNENLLRKNTNIINEIYLKSINDLVLQVVNELGEKIGDYFEKEKKFIRNAGAISFKKNAMVENLVYMATSMYNDAVLANLEVDNSAITQKRDKEELPKNILKIIKDVLDKYNFKFNILNRFIVEIVKKEDEISEFFQILLIGTFENKIINIDKINIKEIENFLLESFEENAKEDLYTKHEFITVLEKYAEDINDYLKKVLDDYTNLFKEVDITKYIQNYYQNELEYIEKQIKKTSSIYENTKTNLMQKGNLL